MAVAASMLTAIFHMLKDGTMYQDLGRTYFDRRPDAMEKFFFHLSGPKAYTET